MAPDEIHDQRVRAGHTSQDSKTGTVDTATDQVCGMALEPMVPTGEPSEEQADFTRRIWISAAAAVPLTFLSMGELTRMPVPDWVGHQTAVNLAFILSTPIVLWAALPFFKRVREGIADLSPNMWTLISPGVGAAYLYLLAATLPHGIFHEEYRMAHGTVGTYFEAEVVIVALIFVGQVLELRACKRTGDVIRRGGDVVIHRLGHSQRAAVAELGSVRRALPAPRETKESICIDGNF